jgi:23S rRNA pseudouridine1911/1915/1917 synthase
VLVSRAVHDRSLETANIAIVFEDDALIAIDKPPGLLTVATDAEKIDTAFARLSSHLSTRNRGRPFVVHRLDRETSGLLLFARSAAIRDQLQAEWDQVTKTYLAVVEGVPRPPDGTVDNFLAEGRDLRVRPVSRERGRRAVTHYRVLAARGACTLVEVLLETGRKHQIRVHLAGLGCPIVGDPVYGATRHPADRMGLHAERLSFVHPLTGMRLELRAPPPDAFS